MVLLTAGSSVTDSYCWSWSCTQTLTLVKPEPECEGDFDALADKPAGKQKKEHWDQIHPEPRTWTVKNPPGGLTGVHVCSVGQWLCLPPEMNGLLLLLLLLLQDEATQVGLDLDPPQTPEPESVSTPGYYRECFLLFTHKPFPALAPAASWPRPSGLQTRLPPAASSSSTRSLREFILKVSSSCSSV